MALGLPHEKLLPGNRARETRALLFLSPDVIRPNPYQPRKQFHEEDLCELTASIREVGLIQPLVVRKGARGDYELIAGERRLRACKLLCMKEIPCVLQSGVGELDSALIALVENVQRRDLHFFEEAECYRAVLCHYGMTQEALASRLGKSQSFLANKLRLLGLAPPLRRKIVDAGLTERHARALLQLKDERMRTELLERVARQNLTVRETERLVARKTAPEEPPQKQRMLRLIKDYRLFLNAVKAGAMQLQDTTGLEVQLRQTDLTDGVELLVTIRRAVRDVG